MPQDHAHGAHASRGVQTNKTFFGHGVQPSQCSSVNSNHSETCMGRRIMIGWPPMMKWLPPFQEAARLFGGPPASPPAADQRR